MSSDKQEFTYDTNVPTGKQTVDRPTHPDNARALEVLRKLVSAKDVRVAENITPMDAPHIGHKMSQRQTAQKIFAGRSGQAVQAWMKGDPMPGSVVDWLLHDLQRVDAVPADRMLRVLDDEIAILVSRSSSQLAHADAEDEAPGDTVYLVTLSPTPFGEDHVKAAFRNARDRDKFLNRIPDDLRQLVSLSERNLPLPHQAMAGRAYALVEKVVINANDDVEQHVVSLHPTFRHLQEAYFRQRVGTRILATEEFSYRVPAEHAGMHTAEITSTAPDQPKFGWSWEAFRGSQTSKEGEVYKCVGFGPTPEEAYKEARKHFG